MKKMKKLASIALALVLALALAVPAFAQEVGTKNDDNPATITIENASKGVTYNVYKVFGATYNEKTGSIAYTYEGALPASLSGVFEKVGDTEYVVAKDGAKDEAILAAVENYVKNATPIYTEKNDDGGKMLFHVPYGYYVVKSDLKTDAKLTVNKTTPNASVYDKNNAGVPTFPQGQGKTANGTTFDLGEIVTYTVKLDTVNWIGEGGDSVQGTAKQVTSYTIKDTATANYLDNVTVTHIKVGGKDICPVNSEDNSKHEPDQFNENGEITIPWTVNDNSLYDNGAQIEITYTATVIGTGAGTNTVTATYTVDDETIEVGKPDPSVTIYNSNIVIDKYETGNKNTKLENAEFKLYKTVGEGDEATNVYYKLNNGKVEWVAENAADVFKTNKDGAATITGLKDGTYYLVETKAPAGYNKLPAPEVVIVSAETKNAETGAHEVSYTAEVQNSTGAELPSTGGIGTTIFTAAGSLLMVGAAVLLITKKRSIA